MAMATRAATVARAALATGSGRRPARRAPGAPTAGRRSCGRTWTGRPEWARSAINYVGATNDWMRDFAPNPDGTYPFQPSTIETRKYFARAVVMAFAPTETVDPSITFTDLDPSDAFYAAANIAVKLHWMTKTAAGTFAPDKAVTMTMVHRVLTLALGLGAGDQVPEPPAHRRRCDVRSARRTSGRSSWGCAWDSGTTAPTNRNDVGPTTPLSRAQVAYSLYRAATQPSWNVPELIAQYQDISLPSLTPDQQAIVQWGVRYAGFPYVYGGEWGIHDVVVRAGGPRLRLLGLHLVAPARERRRVLERLTAAAVPRMGSAATNVGGHGDGRQAVVRPAPARRSDVLRRRR